MFQRPHEHLIALLDAACINNHEAWYESGIDDARKIISLFKPADWKILKITWRSKSAQWQEFLALALTSKEKEQVEFLELLLTSSHKDVAELAFDSLFIDNASWKPKKSHTPTLIAFRSYVQSIAPGQILRFERLISKNKK